MIKTYQDYFQENREEILEDYFQFLRFKSISSEKEHTQDVLACANWLVNYLENLGFTVELWETIGHPVIFATHLKAGPDKPTLLVYNHYDVQPVDPLDLWETPPFEPTIRDGHVFARGAQDNKGQCFYTLLALKALLAKNQSLPVNIKLCIEGEEEHGSAGLSDILPRKKKELKADSIAIIDSGILEKDSPAVTLGVRGIVTMDVELTGSNSDLHSGSYGGMVYNPLHALSEILASLRGPDGKVLIPGFYDAVIPLPDEEKQKISFAFDKDYYKNTFDLLPTGGEQGYSPIERVSTRPTIEVNGISGGYSGDGFKTVIPAKALAKISCRLVPDQDPEEIGKLVASFIEKKTPEGISAKVTIHQGMGKAARANPDSGTVKAFSNAYEEVFQKPCEFILLGGSIPIVTEFAKVSGGELVLLGLGLPSDQTHAPNENFGIDRLEKGFLIITEALQNLASIP